MTSINQERAALAKVGRPLRTRTQAGFRFKNYGSSRPVDEPASRVFVHITVTNPSSYDSDDEHARAVEAIGISRFPSTGLSYNRLIMPSGRAYEGQPIGRRGAHTLNDDRRSTCGTPGCPGKASSVTAPSWNLNVNARSYAICQNVQHPVTDAMLDSLARTIAADMLAGFVRKDAKIHGHRCVSSKSCPGDKMWARMGELHRLVRQYVETGFTPKAPTRPSPSKGSLMADLNSIEAAVNGLRTEESLRYQAHSGWVNEERNWREAIEARLDDLKSRLMRIEADTDRIQ